MGGDLRERYRNGAEEYNGDLMKKRDKGLGAALSFFSVVYVPTSKLSE